ncbi:RNA-binding protein [Candidatus Saccharibacteria bacterium CPR2]|nr:RNA-binding protein [Candidatus Saccharibacteria bacterium CPR2]
MATKLYVGSLPYSVNDDELREFFASHGEVVSAVVIKDRESGRSKGFGFVEFSNDDEAKKAINDLNGQEMSGRAIVVNEARPQEDRRPSGNNNFRRNRY